MLCPAMVNISLLFGAIISWGIMWPLIEAKKGIWYAADVPGSSLHGIQGYKVGRSEIHHFYFVKIIFRFALIVLYIY